MHVRRANRYRVNLPVEGGPLAAKANGMAPRAMRRCVPPSCGPVQWAWLATEVVRVPD